MELVKDKLYWINNRLGQYELTYIDGYKCFFMQDTLKYEYFSYTALIREAI